MGRYTGILGLLTMLSLAYMFSTDRKAITENCRLGARPADPVCHLRAAHRVWPPLVPGIGDAANRMLSYSYVGSEFIFGELGKQHSNVGFIFAFQVCRLSFSSARSLRFSIISESCNSSFASWHWAMTRIMGASGAESLNVAASIFMGQTEAPVTIRPFLPDLTRSELMTVMTSGMAHVSGSIMAAYFAFGAEPRHVLAPSS